MLCFTIRIIKLVRTCVGRYSPSQPPFITRLILALMPVHNQLSTVRRCLVEVKKAGGPYSGTFPQQFPPTLCPESTLLFAPGIY